MNEAKELTIQPTGITTMFIFGLIAGIILTVSFNKFIKSNTFKHLKTICKHKWYVFCFCFKCGIIWRGIKHDMSKFSPTEFMESIKYYKGTSSPIDACKAVNGYSKAWQHHKARNGHHYEAWTDNYDSGTTCIQMPFKDALEMLCDYLGAAKAYMGDDFSYSGEEKWWLEKKLPTVNAMHPVIKNFITKSLHEIAMAYESGSKSRLRKRYLYGIYCSCEKDFRDNCPKEYVNDINLKIYKCSEIIKPSK